MGAPLAGYIRVSRKGPREDERLRSPDYQRALIAGLAERDGHAVRWFAPEIDVSGSTPRRRILDEIVADVQAGRLAGIIVAKLDRLSRLKPRDRLDLFDAIEGAGGVILSASENTDPSTPEGRFAREVFLGVARMQWEKFAEGFAQARSEAAGRGVKLGPTPFGYARQPDGTLAVHPDHGAIITEAFTLAADGGIRPALRYLQQHAPHERAWTASTVRRMLARRVYLGEISDTYTTPSLALTDRATYEHAQTEAARRRPKANFPLSGIARCATCGGAMVGGRGGHGVRTYRCAASLALNPRTCSAPASMVAERLERHVIDELAARWEAGGFTIGEHDARPDDAARALAEAEAELAAYLASVNASDIGPEAFGAGARRRKATVDAARDAYRSALEQARPTAMFVPTREQWATLTLAELGEVLSGGLAAVVVRRGRGPVGVRVRVEPHGTH